MVEDPTTFSVPQTEKTWLVSKQEEDFEKRGTNQFVVLSGELGEPLVKLQDCYYSHQIPEEEETKGHTTIQYLLLHQYHLRLVLASADLR